MTVPDARGNDAASGDGYSQPYLATLADLDIIIHHRDAMFTEMGLPRDERFIAMIAGARPWLRLHLEAATYLGFLIAHDGRVVAGSGLYLVDWPPSFTDAGTRRGHVFDVYVEPAHRRRGLARRVTQTCVDECKMRGIRVVTLHASDAGRGVYEAMGFKPTNEMRLDL
jgi:ribosomal protein S18 acetylase RimI-like enzyme